MSPNLLPSDPETACNVSVTPQNRTDSEQTQSKTEAPGTPFDLPPESRQDLPSKLSAAPTTHDLFDGVAKQVVADFKKLRTKQKAPITQTAMDGIEREASKAGITKEAALTMCCERNWRGFKAEWLIAPSGRASSAAPSRHNGFEKINYSEGIENGRIL
jgi:hypothetical protein